MVPKSVTVKQIQKLDKIAIETFGVPSLALMENAGKSVACEILKILGKKRTKRVSVFCGLGNNAGDGFVVARHLLNAGVTVQIYLIGKVRRLKNDAAVNCQILKKCRYPIKEIARITDTVQKEIKRSDVVVDAIFGVGLNRAIGEPFKSVIEALNAAKKRIVAIDIPSGLDGTSGIIYGTCIKAYKTVTFSFAKKGFYKNQGPKVTGRIVVVDIGIPRLLTKRI